MDIVILKKISKINLYFRNNLLFLNDYICLRQTSQSGSCWTGLQLSDRHIGRLHTIQYHHIFPKSLLRDANYEKKEINEIANMAFIGGKTNREITNKEPIIYFEDIITKRGEDALSSQLIPLDKKQWEISNYQTFLSYRRQAIADEINSFMSKLN